MPKPPDKHLVTVLTLLIAACPCLVAEQRGQAEIAFQGYYLGGNSQPLLDTSGLAANFRYFIPGVGFLSGSMEGYSSLGRVETGENFLELRGVPWAGRHWTLRGGDFRFPSNIVDFPLLNVVYPEVAGRGFQVEASHGSTQYSLFWGSEMLVGGARIPFREQAPQGLLGATARRGIGEHLVVGMRLLRLASSEHDILQNPYLFSNGRDFLATNTAAVQAVYTVWKPLKVFGELSRSAGQERVEPHSGQQVPWSTITGLAYELPNLTVRANYVSQSIGYLPLAGYFTGDRQGSYGEIRYRPISHIDVYASASRYGNNLERDTDVATYQSTSTSAGLSITLPWKVTANGQVSQVRFTSEPASNGGVAYGSRNQQITAGLSRTFGRQTIRLSVRELRLGTNAMGQRELVREVEDLVSLKRLSLSGTARWQTTEGGEHKDSLFFRSSAQLRLGRVTAYSNVEFGNDLVNRSVFATSLYNTVGGGVSARLWGKWEFQADAFKNSLTQDLNPANVFLFGGQGIGVSSQLSAFNQWSIFFRISKQFKWGGGVPVDAMGQMAAQAVPLTGTVEGLVQEQRLDGKRPAAEVPVTLDESRSAITDAQGHYRFADVSEGEHVVALGRDLPADLDPGTVRTGRITVNARRIARSDLDVVRLSMLEGIVTGPSGAPRQDILIRLLPTSRYTSTDSDGSFHFYNLPEGDYELVLDPASLPPDGALTTPGRLPLAVRHDVPLPVSAFEFTVQHQQKPVRKVLEQR